MANRITATLLFTVLITAVVLFSHTGANAKVCIFKIGGTCVFWSGSVKGVLSANVTDDLKDRPKSLGFRIDVKRGLSGIGYCQNPDTKGIKIIREVSFMPKGQVEASEKIMKGNIYTCKGENESVKGAIVNPIARLNDTDLKSLDKFCGDPNFKAIDFVPRIFETTIFLKDLKTGSDIETLDVTCELPGQDKNPLRWDEINQKPEKRQYKCYQSDNK